MPALKANRGTTYTIGVNYFKEGVASTLVGATVRFTMKTVEYDDDATDATAILQKDVTDGTAEGAAEIILLPSDTSTIAPAKYYYDIKVEEATGEIYKLIEGFIIFDGSPTNRGV